ncbi:NAD(P)/FAD-dependent oxidoreductase [Notoacmeibacter ruber]|uniref:FAD/NAD(P)-binding domain-containing protein n=1 Tax=Notoacmeibacter ruber TaxID=2670375 RepID=A0A3L7JD69_9HYPH|nr:FAD-dependent oxidoreductase [Notoacmeibacter ruber]RLQ88420.1 hypothetical protein D8780_09590 [Notoacmeibacter ruber]
MRVVLAGLGHGHLHVVSNARKLADAGADVVLIDDGIFRYSSLAAGILGGQYTEEEGQLSSAALAAACGVRHVRGEVQDIVPAERRVRLRDASPIDYELLSLNLGSTVAAPFPVSAAASVFTAKPLSQLIALRDALRSMIERRQTVRLVVIGGGHSGCELSANAAALGRRYGAAIDITLVSPENRLMAKASEGASAAIEHLLRGFGVDTRTNSACEAINDEAVLLSDGTALPFDHVLLATGLRPPPEAKVHGLAFNEPGGICVRPTLQSISDERVFAIGDCAHFIDDPRPNVGVFGVRAAPILTHNLLARIAGDTMKAYRPQKRWFSALNLGDGTGFGQWGGYYWRGRLPLFMKDRIDRRFMEGYRRLYAGRPGRGTPDSPSSLP